MHLYGIDHIQLAMPTGQADRATAFYEGALGIPRTPKPAHLEKRGGCWFENGAVKIHLGVDPQFRPATKAHPALLIDSLKQLIVALDNAGIPWHKDAPLDGYDRIYLADPFGNRIEVMERLPAA